MSKYSPLRNHLRGLTSSSWTASFADIERILGASLPRSAFEYQEWWANDLNDARQSSAWTAIGWKAVNLSLSRRLVTFIREDAKAEAKEKRGKSDTQNSHHRAANAIVHSWDVEQEISCTLKVKWTPIGRVTFDGSGKLLFPQAAEVPSIYRFKIRSAEDISIYIGETDNLRRRFNNYRNPGPTQPTSLRINDALKKLLSLHAEISVAILNDNAVDFGAGDEPIDLTAKSARLLLENLALNDRSLKNIKILNL